MYFYQPGTLISDHSDAVTAFQHEQFSQLDGGDPPDYGKVTATIAPELFDNEAFVMALLHAMRFQRGGTFIGNASPRLRNDPDFLIRVLDILYGNCSEDEDVLFGDDKPDLACNLVTAAKPHAHLDALSIYAGLITGLYDGDIHEFLESDYVGVFDDPADPAVQALNLAVSETQNDGQPLHKAFWARYQALVAAG